MKIKPSCLIILVLLASLSAIIKTESKLPEENTNNKYLITSSEELLINETINILSGETITYANKIFQYNSSTGPVFYNQGTLKLINCTIIPLNASVDFLYAYSNAKTYLRNVTMINYEYNNTAKLFHAMEGNFTIIDSTFIGFKRADIWFTEDIHIENSQFNLTEQFLFQTVDNITVINSNFDLLTNESTNLFEIRYANGVYLAYNNFSLPFSTVKALGAWIVAVEIRGSENVLVEFNKMRNAGKLYVSYDTTNLAIVNNTMFNDDYVEGSELQIAGGCKDVLIANNTFWNMHDSIEIYDHENVTIIGNHITTDILGFYIKPANTTAPTTVRILNNTQIGGSISVQHANGVIIDNNTLIEVQPIHLINSSNIKFRNNLMINSSIAKTNTNDTTIDGNTIFIPPEFDWLMIQNSTIINGTNIVHIVESNAPVISNIIIDPDILLDNHTINILADITDETDLQYIYLHYKINDSSWQVMNMTYHNGFTYIAEIGPFGNNTNVMFYITAKDSAYIENIGINNNNSNYFSFQILVFADPEPEPEPTPTPTPSPTPTPTPTPSQSPSPTPSPTEEGGLYLLTLTLFMSGAIAIVVLISRKKR